MTAESEGDLLAKHRAQAKTLLCDLLKEGDLVDTVENSIYQETIERSIQRSLGLESLAFRKLYLNKARQIIENLDPSSYIQNDYLLPLIIKGDINALNLPSLTPQELFPSHWDKLVQAKKRRDEIQYSSTTQAMTDTYKCRKCGSRKITYYELQIRSADEGFTTFYTCLGCGCKWKKN